MRLHSMALAVDSSFLKSIGSQMMSSGQFSRHLSLWAVKLIVSGTELLHLKVWQLSYYLRYAQSPNLLSRSSISWKICQ